MGTPSPRFGIRAFQRVGNGINSLPSGAPSFEEHRKVIVSAEKAGFDTVLFVQHTLNPGDENADFLEPWTLAAASAAATSRIELIAAIKPLLYHPVVLAKLALGIEEISEGRLAINFVNGWFKPEVEKMGIPFPEHDARYEYGGEWLRVVKRLLTGESVTWQGKNFNISDYALRPASRHRARPYIYSGGESEPSRSLTAELSDCWFSAGRPVEDLRPLIEDMASRPRSGEPLAFGSGGGLVVARATDREAHEWVDAQIALQDNAAITARRQEMLAKVDPKAQHIFNRRKYDSDPTVKRLGGAILLPGFVGSYDTVARKFAEYYELGLTTFLVDFHPRIEEQERFAAEVIPRVRALVQDRVSLAA